MTTMTKSDSSLTRLIRRLLKRQQGPAKQAAWFGVSPRSAGAENDRRRAPRVQVSASDRRKNNRRTYNQWQFMANFDGKRAPRQTDFRLVLCHDLSPTGFSFYCDKPMRQKKLVIALGTAPFTFFEAEVVRSEWEDADSEAGWLLGCRFVRLLEESEKLQ